MKRYHSLVCSALTVFICSVPVSCTHFSTGDKELLRQEPTATPIEPFPTVEKFPLRLDTQDLAYFAQDHEAEQTFKSFFEVEGSYPVANFICRYPQMDYESATEMHGAGKMNIVMKWEGTSYATLRVQDWGDTDNVRFECEGQAKVLTIQRRTEPVTTKSINDIYRICIQNAIVDLLKKVDARRSELDTMQKAYVVWKESEASKLAELKRLLEGAEGNAGASAVERAVIISQIEQLIKSVEAVNPDDPRIAEYKVRLEELKR